MRKRTELYIGQRQAGGGMQGQAGAGGNRRRQAGAWGNGGAEELRPTEKTNKQRLAHDAH